MRFQDYKACLSSLQPSGTYLLWGNETFLIDTILSKLKDLLFGDAETRGTNTTVLYAADCRASEAVAAASTLPFLGQESLVVVHNISDFPKSDLDVIHKYLSGQVPAALFVLTDTSPHSYRVRTHPAIPKDKARLIDVSSPPPWEFKAWANFFLSREKKRISSGALEALEDNVGSNITTLAMEIEKLICLAGDRPAIDETHTEALLGRTKTESEFALSDAVVSGDKELVLTVFSDLLNEGISIPRMVALVRSQLERIWLAKEMLQSGESSQEISRKLRVPANRMGAFLGEVKGFRVKQLRESLAHIMNAELRTRSEKLNERTVAEMLLLALCNR
jgi:DNA polymerase-3 subunit delta